MTANVRSMAADRKLNEQYENILREAERTDLSRAQNSNCVVIGHDIYNCPIVAFIPNMNFDYGNQSDQILHQLYLLFIKVVHPIARDGPFSIVYSRKGVDWRKPLIYEYYKLLPEKLKKNLMKIYIINPQIGVKMISSIARVFLSADFHSKLFYVQTIADFQRIVPPRKLILPAIFLGSADQDMGLKCSGVSVPLALDYLPAHRTSSIVHRCATFLRSKGCLRKTGLFRVAGNESLLSLVRVRLQPPIFYTKDQMRSFLSKIQIGVEEEEQVIDDRPSMIALQSAPVVHDIAFGYGVSTVVITDTESVAQVRLFSSFSTSIVMIIILS